MKRYILPLLLVSILTACPSPVLQWIDTPVDYSGLGRLAGPGGASIVSLSFGIEGEKDLPIGTEADISGKIPILVILPEGTGLTELIPLVKYIGKSVNPPSGLTGDFSSPVTYTVTGEDNSAKNYIVRVYEKGDSTKEIIRLTLDVFQNSSLGAEGVINQETGDITVTVPAGVSLTNRTARITHTGAGITGPGVGGQGEPPDFTFSGNFSGPTTWEVFARDHSTKTYTLRVVQEKDSTKEITKFSLGLSGETDIIGGEPRSDGVYPILALVPSSASFPATPIIGYRGVAISPDSKSLNFEAPVRYTVTAEDGSTRDYEAQIIRRHLNNDKEITGFYFQNPLVEGVIDQVGHTIALTVPAGTDLKALRPEIYYKGLSVIPMSGQPRNFSSPVEYKVYPENGDPPQSYMVHVFPDPLGTPTVDVPAGGKAYVDVGVGTTAATRKPLVFVEFPTYIYSPTINISYPGAGSTVISQSVTGGIIYNYAPINVEMIVVMPPANPPAPAEAKIDAFYFTNPAAIGDINQSTGAIDITVPYGTVLGNLTATISYIGKEIAGLSGESPIKHTRSFNSAVAPPVSDVKYTVNAYDELTSKEYTVNVTVQKNPAKDIIAFSFDGVVTNAIISALPNADGKYPIEVTVPTGTGKTGLATNLAHTGASIDPLPSTVSNYTSAVTYTVTAEDGTDKSYIVNVHEADFDDDPKILGFYFTNPLAVGMVDEYKRTITVTVPPGTNTGALTPTLYFRGVSVQPGSGVMNNFAGTATYTVTGSTGKTKSYLVMVNPTPSSTKDITRFRFPSVPGAETIIGAVPDSDGTYPLAVWVPSGTPLGSLAPVISHTGVSVSPPAGTVLNFNVPQIYTVIAEDGSAKTYNVKVNAQDAGAKVITSFVFNEVPLATSPANYVRAVGSIEGQTITVMVPSNANLTSNLTPTLTYIGKSILEPGGSDDTANPFTGAGQDFTQLQPYYVKDQNGTPAGYTVHVIKQSKDNVIFDGEHEAGVISSYDPGTSVITVEVNTGEVTGPYDWYVNGYIQAAAGAKFTLNVGSGFTPGKHEIMVTGWKEGHIYSAHVYFTVLQ
jgi:hypothetical protein